MARPQIFISSTFYDLRVVRDDLARAIKELGYETIRHEVGSIPYGRSDKLESSCYQEVENCDILVCIIGGRYGSGSTVASGSITQNELRAAYEQGKQVYVFVEKNVLSERTFYKNNRDVQNLVLTHVGDRKVFDFIDEVDQLPTGNPLFSFENASDIIALLKEQLAGLFQRMLKEQTNARQYELLDQLKSSIATVGELAKYLSTAADQAGVAVKDILLTDHPCFAALRRVTKNRYRIFFADLTELTQWISGARSMNLVEEEHWDAPDYREWVKRTSKTGGDEQTLLKVWVGLFDEAGRLKPMSSAAWKDEYITIDTSILKE